MGTAVAKNIYKSSYIILKQPSAVRWRAQNIVLRWKCMLRSFCSIIFIPFKRFDATKPTLTT